MNWIQTKSPDKAGLSIVCGVNTVCKERPAPSDYHRIAVDIVTIGNRVYHALMCDSTHHAVFRRRIIGARRKRHVASVNASFQQSASSRIALPVGRVFFLVVLKVQVSVIGLGVVQKLGVAFHFVVLVA